MLKRAHYDCVVVGGGFFGAVLAGELRRQGRAVALLEKGGSLLGRASYVNQARVHNGYHYPRSVLTALRSRVNFPRFIADYAPAIVQDFTKLYAVPRQWSKVTAQQFRTFMERISAPIKPARPAVRRLFNAALIEEVFECVEFAFDAVRLREICAARLAAAGVEVALGAKVARVERADAGLHVVAEESIGGCTVRAREVIVCTYSQINELLEASGLPLIRLKHELAEMALVELPEELRSLGVTVMCGPFFSCMPFPPRALHTLSHVRYTPHCSWEDGPGRPYVSAHGWFDAAAKRTKFPHMVRDAARYLPPLARARYEDSLWEVKTVLPQSEQDDSRPILFLRDHGLPGLTCVMGGKLDNIYDALAEFVPAPAAAAASP